MPPPAYCGARIEPWRARPVPFWRYGLAPPPRTSARVLTDAVPRRAAASWATTAWWFSVTLVGTSKLAAGGSVDPDFLAAASRASIDGVWSAIWITAPSQRYGRRPLRA